MKNASFPIRMRNALSGLAEVVRRERSFRTQLLAAVAAVGALIVLRPGFVWAALIALAIALVLALEALNSALEAVIDQVHPDIAPAIKLAKDAAAGAVLIASLAACVVGALMLASLIVG